jgi:hypothetical protein
VLADILCQKTLERQPEDKFLVCKKKHRPKIVWKGFLQAFRCATACGVTSDNSQTKRKFACDPYNKKIRRKQWKSSLDFEVINI